MDSLIAILYFKMNFILYYFPFNEIYFPILLNKQIPRIIFVAPKKCAVVLCFHISLKQNDAIYRI